MLQGMLARAVEWGRITTNPVAAVSKPAGQPASSAVLIFPTKVEAIRDWFICRGRLGDATLISVLAYTGMRPGEALALRWGDILEKTIRVNKRVSLGEIQEGTKSHARADRSVDLLVPLARDLAEWKVASGVPDAETLVFPQSGGVPWTDTHYRTWRRRYFQPAARAAGLVGASPYDLRHSFATLLLHEQRNVIEIAEQLGHAPTRTLDTYGWVMKELKGQPVRKAKEVIGAAREPRLRNAV